MKIKLDQLKHQEIDDAISGLDTGEYGVFYDGAIDLERYSLSVPRILWILKEAVGDYGEDRYSNQLIDKNIRNRSLCKTLRVIAYVSYGILKQKALWSDIPDLYNGAAEILREVAIINVKKAMGEVASRSNGSILRAYDENNKLLQMQMAFYDPDIVIFGFPEACSRIVHDIIRHDAPNALGHSLGECAYYLAPQRKFIWHYHPAKPGNGATYVEEILAAANALLI
jgi:hypothetical protein